MIKLLCAEGDSNKPLADGFDAIFKQLGIKLAPATTKSGTTRRFSERIEKSRLQRTEFLQILKNRNKFLAVFQEKSEADDETKSMVIPPSHIKKQNEMKTWNN